MDSSDSETRLGGTVPPGSVPPGLAFSPGSIFTERYRIIALLGRGAMGEVYRAEDLRLGQPVALKFLPEHDSFDAEARERLFAEARNARSVAHPNVCRVYDVGEFSGRVFLTMEFIDGEDLASLLRRIGHLPGSKALEISRQLCAGLAAAHDRGILHRDLKPSNVMIDGRGVARITDFGLAVNARGTSSPADVAGTMPYMAPERFRGEPATVQSDLYALGLIMYEGFTGHRAFNAPTATPEEWRRVHDSSAPTRPSSLSNDIDPVSERAILRCLEKNPARRPVSAAQVAASLPGGDPLAAALAAGETPSPALVAASGAEGTISRRLAWTLLATCLAGVVLAGFVWQWRALANTVTFAGSPEVLKARARTLLSDFGYQAAPVDDAWWIVTDPAQGAYLSSGGGAEGHVGRAATAVPAPLYFVYRASPENLRPENMSGSVTGDSPPPVVAGDVLIQLDAIGRLTYLRVVPPKIDAGESREVVEPDWAPVVAAADLKAITMTPTAPRWVPPVASDVRRAWTGVVNGEPVRLEAASYRGRAVFARRGGPWDDPQAAGGVADSTASSGTAADVAAIVMPLLWIVTLAAVAVMARRNMRLGRGDRRGALRVAVTLLCVGAIGEVIGRHWIADSGWVWSIISVQQGRALFYAWMMWLCYLAIEPLVRRAWPHLLIASTRLIDGRWRDPLVGQALIAGVIYGTLAPVVAATPDLISHVFRLGGAQPYFQPASLAPPGAFISAIVWAVLTGVTNTLAFVAFMVAVRFVLRGRLVVLVATAAVATLASIAGTQPLWLDFAQAIVVGGAAVWFLSRFGLLALAVGLAVNWVVRLTPWTVDPSLWFAWRAGLSTVLIASVAILGFRNVLGRQAVLPDPGFD